MANQVVADNDPRKDINFVDVTRTLNAKGVPYYICCGTLLRLHRDGGLSPHGGDIDIWFPPNSLQPEQAVRILEDLGFRTGWPSAQNLHGHRAGGRKIDFEFPFRSLREAHPGESSLHEVVAWEVASEATRGGLRRILHGSLRLKTLLDGKIPSKQVPPRSSGKLLALTVLYRGRSVFKPINRCILNAFDQQGKIRRVEYRIPSIFLEELETVSVGDIYWMQPKEVIRVLESLYGSNWSTPSSSQTWHAWAKESPQQ